MRYRLQVLSSLLLRHIHSLNGIELWKGSTLLTRAIKRIVNISNAIISDFDEQVSQSKFPPEMSPEQSAHILTQLALILSTVEKEKRFSVISAAIASEIIPTSTEMLSTDRLRHPVDQFETLEVADQPATIDKAHERKSDGIVNRLLEVRLANHD